MTDWTGGASTALPLDADGATLVGRAWDAVGGGPVVVALRSGNAIDISATFATVRDVAESDDPARAVAGADGPVLAPIDALLANTAADVRDPGRPWLLSPIDLQVVKAAGVTFPVSMLERIIEEKARGEVDAAEDIRATVLSALGSDLDQLVPGSPEAARLKEVLIAENLWSQYLEVASGPTPRSSPRRPSSRPSAPRSTSESAATPSGTIPNRRSCS